MFGTGTDTVAQSIPLVEFNLLLDEPAGEPPPDKPLTFSQLCELEPRLLALYNEVRAIKDDGSKPYFCANRVWDGWDEETDTSFRGRVTELVGYRRKDHPILGTNLAYRVAYSTIYDALPDCRNCVCMVFDEIVGERLADERTRRHA